MMIVERINKVGADLQLDAQELATLGLPTGQKPPDGDVSPLIVPAAEWIEKTFGVILRPGEFRLAVDLPRLDLPSARRDIRIPIGPVISGVVKVDGQVTEAVTVRRGHVVGAGPAAQKIVAEFIAGWANGTIPKPVKIAVAVVCRRWLEHPGELKDGVVGSGMISISQYLELFGGGRPAGGVPWR